MASESDVPAAAVEQEVVEKEETWEQQLAGEPWLKLRNMVRKHADYVDEERHDYFRKGITADLGNMVHYFQELRMGEVPSKWKLESLAYVLYCSNTFYCKMEEFIRTVSMREQELRATTEAMLDFIKKREAGEKAEIPDVENVTGEDYAAMNFPTSESESESEESE
jgi:hypothetical protein